MHASNAIGKSTQRANLYKQNVLSCNAHNLPDVSTSFREMTEIDFSTVQDSIVDPRKRILFTNILNALLKIEKELVGVSRTQITHTSREIKKKEKGLLATPEDEAQAAAIIQHWARVHNGHWENNFIFLREGLAYEHIRIATLNDTELEAILLGEYIDLEEKLTQLNDEYNAVQALKK